MEQYLAKTAAIAVDIGTGWISRHEAGLLAAGDVVRSDTLAGNYHRITCNGEYLCEGETMIVSRSGDDKGDDVVGARIVRLEAGFDDLPAPERGDELAEVLPFAVRLGTLSLPLGELAGAGKGSYLGLGKAFSGTEDAELVVAGIPVAAGKVAVIGENLGLRITRRLVEPFRESDVRITGSVLAPGYSAEAVKDYDFRRPDRFTKRAIDRIADLHRNFLRKLQARIPGASRLVLACVDQLCFAEWAPGRPGSSDSLFAAESEPGERGYELERTPAAVPKRLVIEAKDSSFALSPKAVDRIRVLAESNRPHGARPVLLSFEGAARKIVESDPSLTLTLSCLDGGWKKDADLRLGKAEAKNDAASLLPEWEMIILARFEDAENKGVVELVYPMRTIEPYLRGLNE